MASRLYASTRNLFCQVAGVLRSLGLATVLSRTGFDLAALYVTGLILLDKCQTACRITDFLPSRCHDALNRLLRLMPFSCRAVMRLLQEWVKAQSMPGYLCLDDVVVEKPFANFLPWAAWVYAPSRGHCVYGMHLVVLFWSNGHLRLPVAFRLWRPKQGCRPRQYRTKLQLAQVMITEVLSSGLSVDYVVFDVWYNARWFTKFLSRCGLTWVSTLKGKTYVVYQGKKGFVCNLPVLHVLKWRDALGVRTACFWVYLPRYGHVYLVVTRDGDGRYEYIVSNSTRKDLTQIVQRKRSRWDIETMFREAKQYAGLAACQCRVDQAMVRHVAFVLLTFTVLQLLKVDPSETTGDVKQRLQLKVISGGALAPEPLKARAIRYRTA